MEEKERYGFDDEGFNYKDFETGTIISYSQQILDLLNQQDKQIKELKKENKELEIKLDKCGTELVNAESLVSYLENENKQLKQQLHDLPKKIVEDFYDEIRHRAILEDDYCPDHNLERKYGVRKCLLENIRTTILKKYGGEDESK